MLSTETALEFYVETRRRKGWKRHYEPLADLFEARKASASLAELPGVESRVTDHDGQVWA